VTHCMTLHTSVTEFAPYVQRHHTVKKNWSAFCATCNLWFLSEICFQNHLTHKVKCKLVCQWREVCRNCSFTVTGDYKHECFKRFCNNCNKNQPSGHFCYVTPLKQGKLTNSFMYVFFDTGCTQVFEKHHGSFEHIPKLICAKQMCSKLKRWMT